MTDETASPDGMTMEQAVPKLSAFFAAENGTPPERDNPPAETARAEESPTGDATPQDTAPSGDEQKAEPAEQPPIAPPASWDADAKTRFAKLPREDQEYLIKRESDRDRELRRMQNETAERSKAFEAERAKLAQQLPPFQQQLAQLTAALNNQVMSEFADIKGPEDLARMAETDPARYVRFDARMRLLQQANQAQQQLRQQQEEQNAREAEKRFERESAELKRLVPELMDEKSGREQRKALADFLIEEHGFPPEQVNNLVDAKSINIAWKAMKWDRAQKAAAAAKVVNLPRSMKPGTGSGPRESDDDRQAALVQRARKTGSVKDAAAAISRFLT